MQNLLHSFIDPLRDRFATINHNSDFRSTGQLTPDEFLASGDFLVHRFPSWSWADAPPSQRVSYFPAGKQYLVTRGVPCRKRIKADDFAGKDNEDQLVLDMLKETGEEVSGEDDGWLKAGGDSSREKAKSADLVKDVKTVDDDGKLGAEELDEEEIPDMDDEEDDEEAIIRDPSFGNKNGEDSMRTYTLYITYSPYYRTPRLFLQGYSSSLQPLQPLAMMDDIVGDYKDKTVTLEDFPFVDPPIKTASVHPCKHASVMKVLLDRADAALKLRIEKMKHGAKPSSSGMEGLVEQTSKLDMKEKDKTSNGKEGESEWEILSADGSQDEDVQVPAIRVDQYLVVFLKFMASVTPGIEHDFTMGV